MFYRRIGVVVAHLTHRCRKTNGMLSLTYSSFSSSSPTIPKSFMKKLIDAEEYRKALDLLEQQGDKPSDIHICLALKACARLRDYQYGKKIHKELSPSSLNNPFIQTSLIHFYMQCNDIDNATRLFSSIEKKSNALYGSMFKGFLVHRMSDKFFNLLNEMQIEPDDVNLTFIFNACAQVNDNRAREIGRRFLCEKLSQIRTNSIVLNCVIHMLMSFADVQGAEHIFEIIRKKDIVTYGAMIKGYVRNNMSEKALDIFKQMPFNPNDIIYTLVLTACGQLDSDRSKETGKKILNEIAHRSSNDIAVYNSALNTLVKWNEIDETERLFTQMKKKDVISYSILINGYNLNDQPLKSLKTFEEMKKNRIIPDEVVFTLMINTCAQLGMMSRCQWIVEQIPSKWYHEPYIYCSLIDMWGKAGSIGKAEEIFQSIPRTNDVFALTTMINAYGLNGMGLEAIQLYEQMPEHLRNDVTHVCVLNACSHSALLHHAQQIFDRIRVKTERITAVMIDCLSRLFLFDEAERILTDYEISHPPCLSMYMAILSGARNRRDLSLSKKIYDRMESLFPDRKEQMVAASILLANTYSSTDNYDQVSLIRSQRIKQYGKTVKFGLSWTEVDGEIAQFTAHDRSHPQSTEIHAEASRISEELVAHGHEYDPNWITRPLKAGETIESVLCGHSERLAIAFNFINNRRPKIIQITKNLRVCGDCHRATKLIAQIRQCEIIVRDANRIHHFNVHGQCSCQDHF